MHKIHVSPAVILLFLAPVIAELLTGSAPPVEFFNPAAFVLLVILYGSGAIISRELVFRWGKGWPTLLVLGAAYGILEEGLMVKSFFDPHWVDLGILGYYGRWVGVNWVWSLSLTIFHAVFSINIPILLVGLIFPERRSESWVSPKIFRLLCILLSIEVVLGFLFITSYRPPIIPYLITLIITIALFKLAKQLPSSMLPPQTSRIINPIWFGIIGFILPIIFYITNHQLPKTNIHPLLTMLIMTAWTMIAGEIILKMSGNGLAWSDRHKLMLAGGPLIFFILLAPIQEFDKNRTDNPVGMTIVSLVMLIFLVWLRWRVGRTVRPIVNSGDSSHKV